MQGAHPLAMRILECFRWDKQKMQPKLPDTIIWLIQKMHLNYDIVPAQVMNTSHDSKRILQKMRTADKSSREI